MNKSLEVKKKQLELDRVCLARKELEFKVEEMEAEILRLKEHINKQVDAEEKLKNQITEMNFKP